MRESNHDVTVGGFVLLGLAVVGGLIVTFGRFDDLVRDTYVVTVKAQNANGVLRDSQVFFRGAQVGRVASHPMIANQGAFVQVDLRLRSDIAIPRNSKISIGERGLLGDRYVEITPPDDPITDVLKDGDVVEAVQPTGLNDIVGRLDAITQKLQKELLTDEVLENVRATIASTREAVEKAAGLIDQGSDTMTSVESAVDEAKAFLDEAKQSRGPLQVLLHDEQIADQIRQVVENARKLIFNLRVRGLLFYRDVAQETENAAANPEPEKQCETHPDIRAERPARPWQAR